jgi:hypothetical protein
VLAKTVGLWGGGSERLSCLKADGEGRTMLRAQLCHGGVGAGVQKVLH